MGKRNRLLEKRGDLKISEIHSEDGDVNYTEVLDSRAEDDRNGDHESKMRFIKDNYGLSNLDKDHLVIMTRDKRPGDERNKKPLDREG